MITRFQNDLYLVSLPVAAAGFNDFIGAWVYTGGPVVIIDVGPAATVPALLSALTRLGVKHLDAILLTHIHIDHAGGVGLLARAFPRTPVVCHPTGVQHLVDPQQLWQGSRRTLGDLAVAYGAMQPLNPQQTRACDEFTLDTVRVVETPGHASHHVSYLIGELLFAGEAGGVCLPMAGKEHYLRPATPPRFFLETALKSIDRLSALQPGQICYGHVGLQDNAMAMLLAHRRQLLHWRQLLASLRERYHGNPEDAIQAGVDSLLANDPHLLGLSTMPAAVQSRERSFLTNSVRGFWGYLDTCGTDAIL